MECVGLKLVGKRGGWLCYGWLGWENVWEAEVFEDEAVSDLTQTKNSWVQN